MTSRSIKIRDIGKPTVLKKLILKSPKFLPFGPPSQNVLQKLFLHIPRFIPFEANLTKCRANSDIPDKKVVTV